MIRQKQPQHQNVPRSLISRQELIHLLNTSDFVNLGRQTMNEAILLELNRPQQRFRGYCPVFSFGVVSTTGFAGAFGFQKLASVSSTSLET